MTLHFSYFDDDLAHKFQETVQSQIFCWLFISSVMTCHLGMRMEVDLQGNRREPSAVMISAEHAKLNWCRLWNGVGRTLFPLVTNPCPPLLWYKNCCYLRRLTSLVRRSFFFFLIFNSWKGRNSFISVRKCACRIHRRWFWSKVREVECWIIENFCYHGSFFRTGRKVEIIL